MPPEISLEDVEALEFLLRQTMDDKACWDPGLHEACTSALAKVIKKYKGADVSPDLDKAIQDEIDNKPPQIIREE